MFKTKLTNSEKLTKHAISYFSKYVRKVHFVTNFSIINVELIIYITHPDPVLISGKHQITNVCLCVGQSPNSFDVSFILQIHYSLEIYCCG